VNVLDLFSGLGGWSLPAIQRHHRVVTLDIEARFSPQLVRDILTVDRLEELEQFDRAFDLILASPPCEGFSTGSISRHWGGGLKVYEPISETSRMGLTIVRHTFRLIDEYRDRHPRTLYVIENPRGVMRKVTPRRPTHTTWYCRWGDSRAKPTDLWTNIQMEFPSCHNGNPDHDQQSRYYEKRKRLGQTGGTQGIKDPAQRAIIPWRLAKAIVIYTEQHT
jgi:site-specific DNA-cytosine methylase